MSEGILKSIIAAISGVVTAIIGKSSKNGEESDSSENKEIINQSMKNKGNNNTQIGTQTNNNNSNNNSYNTIYNIYNGMSKEDTYAFIRRLFEEKDPAICQLINEQIDARTATMEEFGKYVMGE